MGRLNLCLPFAGIAFLGVSTVFAAPTFKSCEIDGQGSEIMCCDLNGNGLDDLVLLDGTDLSIYFQDSTQGFERKPQQQFRLDGRPSLVWPARMGKKAESLLMMTSDGVTEFDFTNETSPPARQEIIRQKTIIPEAMDETNAMYFPLSAKTGGDWPLLLAPVADGGLQVWQHQDTWRLAQFITNAMNAIVAPFIQNPGYSEWFTLSLSIGDVNHDGRDDLMVDVDNGDGTETYRLYLQNTNGLFNLEPALVYTNKDNNWRTTIAWTDIQGNGRLDLIKSTVSDEQSFVPGLPSGKVMVAVYMANQDGRIPDAPTQVFRKSDWSGYVPVVDVDGDGFMDLVLGDIPIDSREGFRKMITEKKFNLSLRLHFFRPGAGFSNDTDYERTAPVYYGSDLGWSPGDRLYFDKLLSLNGDFNGDGKKDLLVRDDKDNISVYFLNSRESGFSTRPDLEFPCPEQMDWWQIKDLNGDGISDLIVKLRDQDLFRIFISQGK
ncbi:MAG TPA: VCBS repeat-containing protein [Candidatus Sulfotelmatobacter sp.]|nr:VCBS repeat-containing protein [Candidatus Sulfotelmatobacter sp.]